MVSAFTSISMSVLNGIENKNVTCYLTFLRINYDFLHINICQDTTRFSLELTHGKSWIPRQHFECLMVKHGGNS